MVPNKTIGKVIKRYLGSLFRNEFLEGLSMAEKAVYLKKKPSLINYGSGGVDFQEDEKIPIRVIREDWEQTEQNASHGELRSSDIRLTLESPQEIGTSDHRSDHVIYRNQLYQVKAIRKKSLGETDLITVIHARLVQ